MNYKRNYLGIAVLFLVSASPSYSQATASPKDAVVKEEKLPSADELSEKCAKASGGKAAWAKLNTMIMTGTIDIPPFTVNGKVEVFATPPHKILRITTFP